MSDILSKKIAIVGGGPGGLTLARLLQMRGAHVTVYERDVHKDARPKGATLDLHEDSGLLALQKAGLMVEFEAAYRPGADKLRITDHTGKVFLDEHDNDAETQHGRPEIDRGPLQDLLLNSLLTGTVIWNSRFVAMEPKGSGWNLLFGNGMQVYADLVIAADGAGSKLRKYITPVKPFYSGYTAIEGAVSQPAETCPEMHKLVGGGKVFALGNSQSLIVSAKGDGSLVFYPCFKAEENWVSLSGINFGDKVQVLAWFKKEFHNWNDSWLQLFENANGAFMPRPLYCLPLDQTWEAQPNLTILGDAAHLMPPYAGEGVNMAMQDASELSESLFNKEISAVHFAIAVYEHQMRKRASAAAGMSMDSLEMMHSPEAMDFMMSILEYASPRPSPNKREI
ncbi:FAD-dependent oxidoreductase [Mucilaginibacter ginkgonis]|uniref:Flavin-dependent monooxygenase n=1 Tax=Mucilaginibacter ginkgonis TaxID=2682091 RepID=A0A6I4HZJ3_9SPHI|nr:NAD(P)/FAD-dependent oxidoreductase [Mucilaginibacter ginkgonis]QQL48640.1 FAD-dependent monooxygenase [Mucilaginibacter ginkgonis]